MIIWISLLVNINCHDLLPDLGFLAKVWVSTNLRCQGMRFPGGSVVKIYLGWKDPLEKEMAHSSILAWKIPWTEEPGRLQSTGLQRVGHNLEAKQQQQASMGCKGYGQKWSCGPDGLSESQVQRNWHKGRNWIWPVMTRWKRQVLERRWAWMILKRWGLSPCWAGVDRQQRWLSAELWEEKTAVKYLSVLEQYCLGSNPDRDQAKNSESFLNSFFFSYQISSSPANLVGTAFKIYTVHDHFSPLPGQATETVC